MMEIILLSGKKNVGKTSTLNLLYWELRNKKDTKIIWDKAQVGLSANDFECIIKYKEEKEEKIVAIFTMGDDKDDVANAIDKYNELTFNYKNKLIKIDVLIIACRDNFASKFDTKKIQKNIKKNDDYDDYSVVQEIIESI